MIFTLGSYLRASSLKSASTADSDLFDANSSSIFNDLQRLVFASYIATVNTLTETTLYPPHDNFLNDATYNGNLLDGAAEFVIFSNDVVTLSVRSLIIIPTLAVSLWVIFLVLMFLPIPGKLVAGLSSTRKANQNLEKHKPEQPEPQTSHNQEVSSEPEKLTTPRPEAEVSYKPEVSGQQKPEVLEPEKDDPNKPETEEESKGENVIGKIGDTIQQVLSSDSESESNSMIA